MRIGVISREEELDQLIDSELGRNKRFILAFLAGNGRSSTAAWGSLLAALANYPDERLFSVDVDTVGPVAERFRVGTAPTVVLTNGCQILDSLVGPQAPGAYAAMIEFAK